ncbi:MAG: hydroxymethylglutaryl-CoA reductase, degradative [Chloroflexota bacterium]|nr:hydroxymethylglutaryl-CoA reductase, degradative [Chloroflexota bacterium]
MTRSSRLAGFFNLSPGERLERLGFFADLTAAERDTLRDGASLTLEQADRMIENVVGTYALPLGIATNFRIDDRDYLIPMVVEEPSVVAGASYAAKLARQGGGFHTVADPSRMIGQVQIVEVPNPEAARLRLLEARGDILALANEQDPVIVELGGGATDLEVRVLHQSPVGPMLVVHLIYDTCDAMGANTVNTAVEAVAPLVEHLTSGRAVLRILSNLADRRLARARCVVPKEALATHGFTAEHGVRRILEAYAFAACDPYRAATHNKGIMNGIDAVALAIGNDWRALEAGAHAYASRGGRYGPLTTWERNGGGDLVGSIELPMAVGIVGGASRVHPQAQVALQVLGVSSARELAGVMASVGLAQNLAALRALAMEGIQQGHMKLHARQLAMAAGAKGERVAEVAERMEAEGVVRLDRAEAILRELRKGDDA